MVTKRKAKPKPKSKPKPKKEKVTPAPEVTPAPVEEEVFNMADNNYDPTVVGGRQPIYCPQCKEEVKAQDSYHLSLDNQRYHYPACWQRHELG